MLRDATIQDIPAILDIYRPYILNTAITFEYDVPTLAQFKDRFRAITREFPWLVWEENGEILGYAYGSRAFERAAYGWDADLSIYLRQGCSGRGSAFPISFSYPNGAKAELIAGRRSAAIKPPPGG